MKPAWPEQKAFAFTIFDDPDSQTLEQGRVVYEFLADHGFRSTKGVWPARGPRQPSDGGGTCAEPEYLHWVLELQQRGFEVGYHGATLHTSFRAETIAALDQFRAYFGHWPRTFAQHYYCGENVYWGDRRLTGPQRAAYLLLTRLETRHLYAGEKTGHPCFWADVCQQRIQYVRNFVFGDINTLKVCPDMPYHDAARPLVNYWFASSEGANVNSFNQRIAEPRQQQLEAEGGACIMYAHFAHGFAPGGKLNRRFQELMERLAKRNGWFVPVSQLLDYLREKRGPVALTARQRGRLERKWLWHKVRFGSA